MVLKVLWELRCRRVCGLVGGGAGARTVGMQEG